MHNQIITFTVCLIMFKGPTGCILICNDDAHLKHFSKVCVIN